MSTHNISSCSRKSKIYANYASRLFAVNTHELEQPISNIFLGSKDVRAIKILKSSKEMLTVTSPESLLTFLKKLFNH